MMPRTPGSDAVDLLTTARGTLVADIIKEVQP